MFETIGAEQVALKNKRKSQRFNCWCNLQFQNETTWQKGIATDISEKGIHIVTLKPVKMGSEVKLCFDEPDVLGSCTLVGKVRWKNDLSPFESKNWIAPSMGIEFNSKFPMQPAQFAALNRFESMVES